MPTLPDINYGFRGGLITDGGPFFTLKGAYRSGLNAMHDTKGVIQNRRGIELLDETKVVTITNTSDATNLFIPSLYFADVRKNDGTTLNAIFLRYGNILRIYANDGGTYTSSLENLNITAPDFEFVLSGVSDEAIYYKSHWAQEGNAIIITNSRSPIYKVVWGDVTTGTETFTTYRVEITETNEDLYEVVAAKSKTQAVKGWYSVDIPLVTGTSEYVVDQFFSVAAPVTAITAYKIDVDGLHTQVSGSVVTSHDGTTNYTTITVTYADGVTGEVLRIYIGRTDLVSFKASLAKDQIVISARSQDYAADNSFAPRRVMQFGGRTWFAGVDGILNQAEVVTYPAFGRKYRKVWVSGLFPPTLVKEEISVLSCETKRGPFDADDSVVVPSDGGIFEPDSAGSIQDLASYGTNAFVLSTNGVWAISGPDEVFSLTNTRISKMIEDRISAREPAVSTENGLFIFGDADVYAVTPPSKKEGGTTSSVPNVSSLVENRIQTLYNSIPLEAKAQAFVRDDSYNRRVYYFYPKTTTNNKYKTSGLAQHFLIYDRQTRAWMAPQDITQGSWGVFDMTTIPADSYFSSPDDPRSNEFKKVNLVVLGKKDGNFTTITFGILEGKNYCSDYHGTEYKAPFSSYIETYNSFAEQLGVANKKAVYRLYMDMKRTEQTDAVNGFYEFPGAVYLSKRIDFADHKYAGPLYANSYNSGTDTWLVNRKQVYFPNKLGSTVIGGGVPPFEVIKSKLKMAGKGASVSMRLGNAFGLTTATELTGTIQEQEKPWGIYGYQLELKRST